MKADESQPKPNYERLEEMLDRSGSQPGEPEIQKIAEDYADTCFAHGSFRWEHVVKMYLKGISDYRLWLLQKSQIKSEKEETPSREPYPDNLKTPVGSQPGKEEDKGKWINGLVLLIIEKCEFLHSPEDHAVLAYDYMKSQPSQPIQGKPFSEAIKDPSFHQKYWEEPPLPEQRNDGVRYPAELVENLLDAISKVEFKSGRPRENATVNAYVNLLNHCKSKPASLPKAPSQEDKKLAVDFANHVLWEMYGYYPGDTAMPKMLDEFLKEPESKKLNKI